MLYPRQVVVKESFREGYQEEVGEVEEAEVDEEGEDLIEPPERADNGDGGGELQRADSHCQASQRTLDGRC